MGQIIIIIIIVPRSKWHQAGLQVSLHISITAPHQLTLRLTELLKELCQHCVTCAMCHEQCYWEQYSLHLLRLITNFVWKVSTLARKLMISTSVLCYDATACQISWNFLQPVRNQSISQWAYFAGSESQWPRTAELLFTASAIQTE